MGNLKITPTSTNSLTIELYQWNRKDHVCVGSFEVSAVEDELKISAKQDWQTHHRNNVELSYYANEPKFHLEKIGVFHSFKVKELQEKSAEKVEK